MPPDEEPAPAPGPPQAGRVASPCVGSCRLRLGNVCMGCGRHLDEIIEWLDASDERRREIVEAAKQRKKSFLFHDR